MSKLPQCDTCLYCAHHWAIVCTLHPDGVEGDSCKDYEADPDLKNQFVDFLGLGEAEVIHNPWHPDPEENWAPDEWAYVNGELVRQPSQIGEVDSSL